jgi:Na+-driven multidrug efflux pump
MANETMWAGGVAMLNQCYSRRGLHVVEANNICQTFFNVFSVSFIAVGAAVAIIVGQLLGAGKLEEARDSSTKLITFSVMVSTAFAVLLAVAAEFIPRFYNTTDDVRSLATGLMRICALIMPLDAFVHSSYFTIRSGGKMLIAFLFDSGFSWAVSVPVAFVLSRFTSVPILPLFLICQLLVVIKCALGFYFVRRGDWLVNMVADESAL